ncbi:MAG TPA: tetraacyldisaccharide 4'-kinase [Rhodanobacteraceae bacterium]|nr:tetraacyldisaccharide 4'-kinase [Rhodanobacteraceae bacterium]
MAIADDLQRRWYDPKATPPWWTLPVTAVFGCLSGLRRSMYRRGWLKSTRLPVPVIVVGNLGVGGTGKTPLTIALVEALRAHGFKPGVVSRGYGGTARVPTLLDAQPDPRVVGDEPALIRLRTGVPVAVGAERPAAARLLLQQGVDVVIADDGLQHYALARDIEICVVDGARRFGNARLLPAGPLREPLTRLHDVDFVVCNGGEPHAGEVSMQLAMGDAVALSDPSRTRPLGDFKGERVHAVAGIGNPVRFFEALRAFGIDVVAHPFADHQSYKATDLAFGDDAPVLMTEKDAVKCRAFAAAHWWRVPVSARLPEPFLDDVASALARPQ